MKTNYVKNRSNDNEDKNLCPKNWKNLADDIMRAAQLGAALEVSGWPKPGNVHRTADFADTRFEHFIAGSISLGPAIRDGALKGYAVEMGRLKISDVGVGILVKRAVLDMKSWHNGGNTHLGVILLFIPVSIAAGRTLTRNEDLNLKSFSINFREVMESTTSKDATEVYEAITIANPSGLGTVKNLGTPDVTSKSAKQEIVDKNLSLYDLMKISASWDTIALELTTSMKITLEIGYPNLIKTYLETHDINVATVNTYLKLLSEFPDTFIARNIGLKSVSDIAKAVDIGMTEAKEISKRAGYILQMGGLTTMEGKRSLFKFDEDLRKTHGKLSPGTTADLTAASLMVALMRGLRF